MSTNSNDQVGNGLSVHPRRDDDSAFVPPVRSRGLPPLPAVVVAWPEMRKARKAIP